jgi:hypothetical protein
LSGWGIKLPGRHDLAQLGKNVRLGGSDHRNKERLV